MKVPLLEYHKNFTRHLKRFMNTFRKSSCKPLPLLILEYLFILVKVQPLAYFAQNIGKNLFLSQYMHIPWCCIFRQNNVRGVWHSQRCILTSLPLRTVSTSYFPTDVRYWGKFSKKDDSRISLFPNYSPLPYRFSLITRSLVG